MKLLNSIVAAASLRRLTLTLCLAFGTTAHADDHDWRRALPGWNYQLPRDHFDHPDFKTEWWYFTGHLKAEGGRLFGYQVTFFRQGIRPPSLRSKTMSRFVRDHFYFGHFALTDLSNGEFHFTQRLSRGAFGEAGASAKVGGRIVWLEDWSLSLLDDGSFRCITSMADEGIELDLTLVPAKPYVMHGEDGVSQKAAGKGNASHYYSCSRIRTSGIVKLADVSLRVTGESWLDREWATNQLAVDQTGWDWFSLQLDSGAELMLYQLRRTDGSYDPLSSGTWIEPGGASRHLKSTDFEIEPVPNKIWKSSKTGANYPIQWRLRVPSLEIDIKVTAALKNQELALHPLSYWEGAVHVTGTHRGRGYTELTGYGGDLGALRSRSRGR
jgi:predicted secreted hydrolase